MSTLGEFAVRGQEEQGRDRVSPPPLNEGAHTVPARTLLRARSTVEDRHAKGGVDVLTIHEQVRARCLSHTCSVLARHGPGPTGGPSSRCYFGDVSSHLMIASVSAVFHDWFNCFSRACWNQALLGSSAPPGPWHWAQKGLRPSFNALSASAGS